MFAISGAAALAIGVGTAVVGASIYSADQQRKNLHQQQDAVKAAQLEDARKTAQAEVDTQVAANSQIAAVKRRRRDNSLALGTGGQVLGGGAVLGAGTATTQVASKPAGTALGGGAM